MNIYEKLQTMRVALQEMGLKKSGKNSFAGYSYYELADITPSIMKLELEYKVCSVVTFNRDKAILTLINTEKPEETIVFESPMAEASLKGAHAIQNLGAVETYQRRYLYMNAYEVVEADVLDQTHGKPQQQQQQQQRQPQRPAKKLLSEENSAKLNQAVKDYCAYSGFNTQQVVAELSKALSCDMAQLTDKDVSKVLNQINNWMEI